MRLNTLIEQLKEYKKMYGNVEVNLCIRELANLTDIKDILADSDGVTLYNWI